MFEIGRMRQAVLCSGILCFHFFSWLHLVLFFSVIFGVLGRIFLILVVVLNTLSVNVVVKIFECYILIASSSICVIHPFCMVLS